MVKTLLMTGAAGTVGRNIRPFLPRFAETVILSDIVPVEDLAAHERFVPCNLADAANVQALVKGVDAILHLGGVSVERPFDELLQGNIIGLYNLFEAARHAGKPRIVFGSSNHVIGFYRRDERIDNTVPPKPDSLYGVTKAFGEAVASFYHSKFGQECLSVRIGSCFPQPKVPRMLATWLSVEDLADLCARAFAAPLLGHTIIYGASDNEEQWWDNSKATFLGWKPKHSSTPWRAEVLAASPPESPTDPAVIFQGGAFCTQPHPADTTP